MAQDLWRAERTRAVRKHDKGPKTALADFFNILLVHQLESKPNYTICSKLWSS